MKIKENKMPINDRVDDPEEFEDCYECGTNMHYTELHPNGLCDDCYNEKLRLEDDE